MKEGKEHGGGSCRADSRDSGRSESRDHGGSCRSGTKDSGHSDSKGGGGSKAGNGASGSGQGAADKSHSPSSDHNSGSSHSKSGSTESHGSSSHSTPSGHSAHAVDSKAGGKIGSAPKDAFKEVMEAREASKATMKESGCIKVDASKGSFIHETKVCKSSDGSGSTCNTIGGKFAGKSVTIEHCINTSPGKAATTSDALTVEAGKSVKSGPYTAEAKAGLTVKVSDGTPSIGGKASVSMSGPGLSKSLSGGVEANPSGATMNVEHETCVGGSVQHCHSQDWSKGVMDFGPSTDSKGPSGNPGESHHEMGPLGHVDHGFHGAEMTILC